MSDLTAALEAFRSGLPVFLLFTGVAGILLILSIAVYIKLTPWRELALVKDQNGAAGLALAGAIVGLAIPISSCLANSVSLPGLIIWGVISLLLQAGPAIVLVGAKLASASLLAAGLWDPSLHNI